MVLPGLLPVVGPVAIGLIFRSFGVTARACRWARWRWRVPDGRDHHRILMALMMNNGGGAWDNAKKFIERRLWRQGSEVHKATVVGDTVAIPSRTPPDLRCTCSSSC